MPSGLFDFSSVLKETDICLKGDQTTLETHQNESFHVNAQTI